MKQILNIISSSILGLLLLVSCERTDDLVEASVASTPVIQTSSFSSNAYTITKADLPKVFETIEFTKAVFNNGSIVESQLEIALAGTDFAYPISLGESTSETSVAVLYSQLNNALIALGAEEGKAINVDIRVKSGLLSTNSTIKVPAYSAPVTISVVPYIVGAPEYAYIDLFLVGDATAAGWSNEKANVNLLPLQKTNSENVYTFTGYFKQGGFKIIKEKGSWEVNYGGVGGNLALNGDNIAIPTAGYYKLTIDTTALTYTLVPVETPTESYATVGIIGSATPNGWDSSTAMRQSAFDENLWILEKIELQSGELKFRANDGWEINWGGIGEFFGTANRGGDNIKVETAWTYTIYFNSATGNYSIIPEQE